jgi:hypothetical protein
MNKSFSKILDFISSVSSVHPSYKQLKMYNHLLKKINEVNNVNLIEKNVRLFSTFCEENKEAILSSNESGLVNTDIKYSDSVTFSIKHLFTLSDNDTKKSIWEHLLCILGTFSDPDTVKNIKDIVKKNDNKETEFINGIMSKVETSMSAGGNPSDLLSSGMLSEITNGLSNGDLDVSKLLGVVKGLVSNLDQQVDESDVETKQTIGMMSNLINNIGSDNQNIDMSEMMKIMNTMMRK